MAKKNSKLEKEIKNYDPDTELHGSGNVDFGHNLAEAIMNGAEDSIKSKYFESLKYTPKEIQKSSQKRNLMKSELNRLKKAGLEIQRNYDQMSTNKIWNFYINTLKDIGYNFRG